MKHNDEAARRKRIEERINNPQEDLGTQVELRPVRHFDLNKRQADVFNTSKKAVA